MMSLALTNAINYIQRPVYLSFSEDPVDSGYVYILTNDRLNVLYVPVTSDLKRRIYHHKRRLIAGFTRKYNVDRPLYFERFPDMAEARSREKKLKGICRARKDGTDDETRGRPNLRFVQRRVDQVLGDIETAIHRLKSRGFRRLVLVNLAELGGIKPPIDLPKMEGQATNNEYTLRHNRGIQALQETWHSPDFKVSVMDAYGVDKKAREQPGSLALKTVEPCYSGNLLGYFPGWKKAFCDEPLTHKQWDRLHPSTRMHCFYATEFFATLQKNNWIADLDKSALLDACLAMTLD